MTEDTTIRVPLDGRPVKVERWGDPETWHMEYGSDRVQILKNAQDEIVAYNKTDNEAGWSEGNWKISRYYCGPLPSFDQLGYGGELMFLWAEKRLHSPALPFGWTALRAVMELEEEFPIEELRLD